MLKYSLKRILLALITAFIILTITFFLVKSLPFSKIITTDANIKYGFYQDQVYKGFVIDCNTESPQFGDWLEKITTSDGVTHFYYETPIFDQYIAWITRIVTHWDWGTSTVLKPNYSTTTIIIER